MSAEEFFDLFLKELEQSPHLHSYYKFLGDEKSFLFRKAYFIERLKYIERNVTDKNAVIWDCGCGYGTTDIFLAINGFKVHGTTLEFYDKVIPQRLAYWGQFGNVSGFTYSYENLFDQHPANGSIDIAILQDTLHHLEPLQEALKIFHDTLKPSGKLIAVEENGSNIIQTAKLYKQRGNKRIIEMYDEQLGKTILLGNENIRSTDTWAVEFAKQHFTLGNVEYVRLFLPFMFNKANYDKRIADEKRIWRKNSFLRQYFYFGLNFVATRN